MALIQGQPRRVLVVDDEANIRTLLSGMLMRQGFSVIHAENGSAAYALFCESPGDFDALITDIVMPEMDGIELGRRIKAQYPDFPILFVSAYTDRHPPNRRNTKFVPKPFTARDIEKALKSLLPRK